MPHEARQVPSWLIFDVSQKMRTVVTFFILAVCSGCATKMAEPAIPATRSLSSEKDFEGRFANQGVCHRPTVYYAPQKAWLDELLIFERTVERHTDAVIIRCGADGISIQGVSGGAVVAERKLRKDVDYRATHSGIEILARPKSAFVEDSTFTKVTNRFVLRLTEDRRLILDCVQDTSGVALVIVPYSRHEHYWCEFKAEG